MSYSDELARHHAAQSAAPRHHEALARQPREGPGRHGVAGHERRVEAGPRAEGRLAALEVAHQHRELLVAGVELPAGVELDDVPAEEIAGIESLTLGIEPQHAQPDLGMTDAQQPARLEVDVGDGCEIRECDEHAARREVHSSTTGITASGATFGRSMIAAPARSPAASPRPMPGRRDSEGPSAVASAAVHSAAAGTSLIGCTT